MRNSDALLLSNMGELLRYQLFLASTVLFLQVWRTSLANCSNLSR
jgi:hypothetical protein